MKNMAFILLFYLSCLAEMQSQSCADTLKLNLAISYEGIEMVVDVQVENFKDIAGFQFGLNYDSNALSLISATSPLQNSGNNNFGPPMNGNIPILYTTFDPSQGLSLPDQAIIASFRFSILTVATDVLFFFDNVEFVDKTFTLPCVSYESIVVGTNGNLLSGYLKNDLNKNCSLEASETGLQYWKVELTTNNKKYYRVTDKNGFYSFGLPPGEYSIRIINPYEYLWYVCDYVQNITLQSGETQNLDVPIQPIRSCPIVYTDISTPFLRRCFDNSYYLTYRNEGSAAAENATLEVVFDSQLTFISTDYTAYSVSGNKIVFNLGELNPGDEGKIRIIFNLNCEGTILGQAHCVTATAFPNDLCIQPPAWSGAIIALDALCDESDNKVVFTIKNTGNGDMTQARSYIVTEDDVMRPGMPVLLESQETSQINLPANGSTYRLTIPQESGFPYDSKFVSLAIEGCGENQNNQFSTGFVNLFEESDRDPFIDTDCHESIGSYDPNDISGLPEGYGLKHYIEKDVRLDYLIRFQNTGTDTAFNVVVKNYLPLSLDISTLQMGASSHPYHYKITQDREIVMTFQNILLVDSTKNETASHGFVKYNIRPSADLEDEDQILNEANIFFDFNPAIKTNEAKHTVGSNFIISKTNWIDKPFDAKFYPNPAQQQIIIDLRDVETKDMTFSVTNVAGQTISQGSLTSGQNMISCQHMSPGRYTVHVFGNGKLSASVSIIKI